MTELEIILQNFHSYLIQKSYKTANRQTKLIKHFITKEIATNYKNLHYNDLLTYINKQKDKGQKANTINYKLRILEHFYTWLEETNKITTNPIQALRIKGEIYQQHTNLLTEQELATLYTNYPNANLVGKRNKIIVGLMVYQGLHRGELRRLETKDINLEEGKIYIQQTARSNERTLNLEANQLIPLQNYLHQIRPMSVSYTHLRAHETRGNLVCRLLLE